MMAGIFAAYLLMVLVVGIWSARYGKTMEGYFLANRRLGPWVTGISATASSESGWLVLGLVGEAYMFGAKAVWTVHGVLLGYLMNWFLIAPRLRAQSGALGAITVPGYFASRFSDLRAPIRLIGVLVIVASLLGYVAAQFTATGKAFEGAFGISYQNGVVLGAAITVLYTLVGGFRAVAWTDLVQGLLMAIGLVVLPLVAVGHIGGPAALWSSLAEAPARVEGVFSVSDGTDTRQIGVESESVDVQSGGLRFHREDGPPISFWVTGPAYSLNGQGSAGRMVVEVGDEVVAGSTRVTFAHVLDMPGGADLADTFGGMTGAALFGWVIGLLGIGLGYPGQPHILTRFMAAADAATIRRARVIAVVWGVLVMYGALILGHAARLILPRLVDPEQAYPVIATDFLPPIVAGVVLAAIVSAMMSTADSQLLVVASAIGRDLFQKTIAPGSRDSTLQWISRGAVFVVGVAAFVVALADVRAVFWFVLFAWSGLGAAFGPPMLLCLLWPRTSAPGVLAGMLSGAGMTVYWKLAGKTAFEGLTGCRCTNWCPRSCCRSS